MAVTDAPPVAPSRKLWQFIPPQDLQRTPITSLRPKVREILDIDVPPDYPSDRAAKLGQMIGERLPRMVVGYKRNLRREWERAGFETPEQAAAAGGPGVSAAVKRFAPSPMGRLVRSTISALPSAAEAPEPMVPARNFVEHASDFAGGTAGFVATAGSTSLATAGAGALVGGPVGAVIGAAAPLVGLGVAGFTPAGTMKERTIRAGANVTLGAFAHKVGRLAQKLIPGRAGQVAAHTTTAGTFGAGVPVAETAAHKATGDKDVEWPTLEDMAKGTASLLGLNLLLGARGLVGKPRAPRPKPSRLALPAAGTPEAQPAAPVSRQLPPSSAPSGGAIVTPPPTGPTPPYVAPKGRQLPPATEGQTLRVPPPPLAPNHQVISDRVAASLPPGEQAVFVEMFRNAMGTRWNATTAEAQRLANGVRIVARSLAEPTPPNPAARQRAMQLTAELNEKFAGKTLRLSSGGATTEATVVRLAYFPYPGERRPIRLIAADPTTGEVVALDFQSVGEFTGTLGGGGVSTGKAAPSRSAAISALETAIRERPGDKNVARWRRRLERLRSEQAAGAATAPPSPAVEIEGERSPRVAPPSQPPPAAPPVAPAAAAPARPAPEPRPASAAPGARAEVPALPERVRTMAFKSEEEANRVAAIMAKQKPGSDPKVVEHKGQWTIEVTASAVLDPKAQERLEQSRQRLAEAIESARAGPPKPPEKTGPPPKPPGGEKPPEEGGTPAPKKPEPPKPVSPAGEARPGVGTPEGEAEQRRRFDFAVRQALAEDRPADFSPKAVHDWIMRKITAVGPGSPAHVGPIYFTLAGHPNPKLHMTWQGPRPKGWSAKLDGVTGETEIAARLAEIAGAKPANPAGQRIADYHARRSGKPVYEKTGMLAEHERAEPGRPLTREERKAERLARYRAERATEGEQAAARAETERRIAAEVEQEVPQDPEVARRRAIEFDEEMAAKYGDGYDAKNHLPKLTDAEFEEYIRVERREMRAKAAPAPAAAPEPAPAARGQTVPERGAEGAAPTDRGAVGKAGVEHPEHIDFALSRALEQTGAAKELAEMAKRGASDAEIRTVVEKALRAGGGESAIGMQFGERGGRVEVWLTRKPEGLKGPTEIGPREIVGRIRENLGIPEPSEPAPAGERPQGKYPPGTRVLIPYQGKRRAKRTFDRGRVVNYSRMDPEPMVQVQVARGGRPAHYRDKWKQRVSSRGARGPTYEIHEIPERLIRRQPMQKTEAERVATLKARGERLAKGKSIAQLEKRLAAVETQAMETDFESSYRLRRVVHPAIEEAIQQIRRRIDDSPGRDYAAFDLAYGKGESSEVSRSAYERGPGRIARHNELTRDAMIDVAETAAKDPAMGTVLRDLHADDVRIAKEYEARFSPEKVAERMKGAQDPKAEWEKIAAEADELLPPSPADYSHGSADAWGGSMSAFGVGEIGRALSRIFHRKVLSGIPRAQELLRRQTGSDVYKARIQDRRGNTRESGEYRVFKDDPFTNSAAHGVAARLGHGRSALEPDEVLHFVDARATETSMLQDFYLRRATALGDEGMAFSAPYTPGARHLSRATEGSPLAHSIPAHLSHVVDARRAFLRSVFDDMNAARVQAGMKPIPPHKGLYTPHNTIGAFAEAYDDVFKQLAGRPMTKAEIAELKNKHLEIREGDTKYLEDSAMQDYLYMIRAARYIAYLPFFKRMGDWVQKNRDTNPDRAKAVDDWMKSVFFPEKTDIETKLDGITRLLTMAKQPKPVNEITKDQVAQRLGKPVTALDQYERVYSTEHGAKVRGTDPTAITHLGTHEGFDYYGVTKGHVVPDQPFELRGPLKAVAESPFIPGTLRFRARMKHILDKLPGGKRAGFVSKYKHTTLAEREAAAIAELTDAVQRFGDNPTQAWTALIGRNQVRALLSGNISAVTQNAFNNVLTSYPEFGLTAVLRGLKAEAKGTAELRRAAHVDWAEAGGWITKAEAEALRKAIKLTPSSHLAEALGSLQGEIPRRREAVLKRLAGADALYRKALDAMDPMNPYRGVEDLTRGVDAYAAAVVAARMGLSPVQARRIYDATQASRIALNRKLSERITDASTAEAFIAQNYATTMFDYGPLGQLNLHRHVLGGWLGRLTTFPTNYGLNYEYRPVAGTQAVLFATVRGVMRSITGGKVGKKQPGAVRTFGRRFKRAGEYPPPRTPLGRWLEEGGAGWYQRQAAKVFVRQLQLTGALAALSAGTGLNFFVVGTPGYHYLMAEILRKFFPENERLKEMTLDMRRGAIINYARGAFPLGPTAHLIGEAAGRARGVPARIRKLSAEDTEAEQRLWHIIQGFAEVMTPPIAEFMRQITGQPILALRRFIEVEPEFFDRVDPDHRIYKFMGVKTVYEGLTKSEKWKRQHNLLGQKRLDETKRKAVPDDTPKKAPGGSIKKLPGMQGLPKRKIA